MPYDEIYSTQNGGYPIDEVIVVQTAEGEPEVRAHLVDAEWDPLTVKFGLDGTVRMPMEDQPWVLLDLGMLEQLGELSKHADEIWSELDLCLDEEGEVVSDIAHLVTQRRALVDGVWQVAEADPDNANPSDGPEAA